MQLFACVAKIHRARVTEADPNYVGSITIDNDLLHAAGIVPFQYLNITNASNGVFWRTYAMAGEPGSGTICLNGPPSRHFQPGDIIIILAEAIVTPQEFETLNPVVVFVDERNKITRVERHKSIPHPLGYDRSA
jgi:aspartate 1-decarboxylase